MPSLTDAIKTAPDSSTLTGVEYIPVIQNGRTTKIKVSDMQQSVLKGTQGIPGPQGERGLTGPSGAQGTSAPGVVDLSNAVADYTLAQGETAYRLITGATATIPLYIGLVNNGIYEVYITGTGTNTSTGAAVSTLYPNGTTYASAIRTEYDYSTGTGYGGATLDNSSIYIGEGLLFNAKLICMVNSYMSHCQVIATSKWNSRSYSSIFYISCKWLHSSNAWTSLGTINLGQSNTGLYTIKRIV